MDRYRNISDHGLIGDLQTAALVTQDGTIDFFCCPRFDSASVSIDDFISPTDPRWLSNLDCMDKDLVSDSLAITPNRELDRRAAGLQTPALAMAR